MNPRYTVLRPHLQQLAQGSLSHESVTSLVHFARNLVEAYLRYVRSSALHLCATHGITITDLAYDCVAEAFARTANNRFQCLENFVASLERELDAVPDLELFLAFKALMARITDAQLARLYAQSDPTGARIHRNIRDSINVSVFFRIGRDYRGLVVTPRSHETNDHLESYPVELLEKEIVGRIDHQDSTPEFLKVLQCILVEQPHYRRTIPLVELVKIMKKMYGRELEAVSDTSPSLDGLTGFELERLRMEVETALKEKIVFTYLARGKIDRREAEAIFRAFQGMLDDWYSSGDSQRSLYQYLIVHLRMDEGTYENTLRTKMEYLLKIVREEFSAKLMREI